MKKKSNILDKIIELKLRYKVLLIIGYILISIGLVFVISNKFNLKYRIFNEVSVYNNVNKIIDGDKAIYEFSYSPLYTKKIFIKYNSNSNFNMGVNYKYGNEEIDVYSTDVVEECSNFIDLNVIHSKALTNHISITVPSDVVINDVILNNKLDFNYFYLFLFIIILMIIIGILIVYHYGMSKLHILFMIFYICFGSFMIIFSNSTLGASWDDQIHFDNTIKNIKFNDYNISESEDIAINLKAKFSNFNTIEEQELINNKLNELDKNEKLVYNTNIVSYTSIAYLPSSILYNLFKTLGCSFVFRIIAVKLISILIYAFIIGYAIKKIVKYKLLLFVIGLIPTGLFIACNFNYDAVIFSLTLLGFATFVNMMNSNKVSSKELLLYVVCLSVATLVKVVYAPLLLLLLLIPKDKFKSVKNARNFKILLLIITLLVSFTFIICSIFSGVGYSDMRGGANVSVLGQINYIIHNPVVFGKMFLETIVKNFTFMLGSNSSFLSFAYRGELRSANLYLLMIIAFILAFLSGCNEKNDTKIKNKILILLAVFLVICMIWGVLYVSFNDVGSMVINGVQPRYFMPLLPFIFYAIINSKVVCKIDNFKLCTAISIIYIIVYVCSMQSAFAIYSL